MKLKTIDDVCGQSEGSFNKHLELQNVIFRAGELWRKINIQTARKLHKPEEKIHKCPKCKFGILDIMWDESGMYFKCLKENCKFEYPN
jgi:hypothetical protein